MLRLLLDADDGDDYSRTAAEALLMHNPTLLRSDLPALASLACARRKETGTTHLNCRPTPLTYA